MCVCVCRVSWDTSGELHIVQPTESDTGQYKCTAVNIHGLDSETSQLQVAGEPFYSYNINSNNGVNVQSINLSINFYLYRAKSQQNSSQGTLHIQQV